MKVSLLPFSSGHLVPFSARKNFFLQMLMGPLSVFMKINNTDNHNEGTVMAKK